MLLHISFYFEKILKKIAISDIMFPQYKRSMEVVKMDNDKKFGSEMFGYDKREVEEYIKALKAEY